MKELELKLIDNWYFKLVSESDRNSLSRLIFWEQKYFLFTVFASNNNVSWNARMRFYGENLNEFIDWYKKLELKKEIILRDDYSDSYISICRKDSLWHYNLIAQIWWSYEENFCKILLVLDTISLDKLISYLNNI